MKISIITIALNEAKSIGECLNSVSRQTYPDIEHIIVDGGSTDGTLSIVDEYAVSAPYPVKIINQSECNGLYGAINEGIAHSQGEIIGLLHANDFYNSDNELQIVADAFKTNHTEIVYGNIRYFNSANPTKTTRIYYARRFKRESLMDGFMPPHPAFFATRRLLTRNGCYPTDLRIAGDFEMIVKLLLVDNEPIVYIDRIIVAMSSGGVSGKIPNRLYRTIFEKHKVLRRNGFDVSIFRLFKRYLYLFHRNQ